MEEKDSNNDASGKVRLLNTPESSSTNQASNLRNSMAKKTLNEDVEQHYVLYFYLFSVLGLVNNLGYVMVGSAAHNLADKFDHKSLMPLFNLCEIVFGSLVRFINSKYLINIRHSIRLTGNVIVMIVAYLLIAAITIHPIGASFYIALFCALLHGVTSSFGESTLLGFLKGFPSKQVGSFSSGTGMAGVCGSGIFLLLGSFMSDGFVFLAATPAILFYFMNVMITSKKKSTLPFVEENPQAQARAESIRRSMGSNNDLTNSADDNEITNEEDEGLEGIEMGEDAEQNLQMGFASFKLVLSKIGWYTLNLFLVYFLEYSVT
ncbi:unnamed protein product [Moneuplotes crassus]|uniref:Battenin n=1 Tax=Euplotes crassus TaxID=5936 RepID=A0AAD1UNN8_EUPCR|nr:unnamed protein product [Moneuplotes crassus]